ncbi:MAG: GNAT family protein, partial [Deinococcales bacterium]
MTPQKLNHLGQPIGESLHWSAPPLPTAPTLTGRLCYLERLRPEHALKLYEAYQLDTEGRLWTYLPAGPFDSFETFLAWFAPLDSSQDPLFYAIIDSQKQETIGMASYLRIDPKVGSIEVGHINFSPKLQKSPLATEAMYLMMRHAFELGYRRYEWKCDALNEPSRKAADRLGFQFEGIFRQATIYKGRNRDTAWYSIIDKEWPLIKQSFET